MQSKMKFLFHMTVVVFMIVCYVRPASALLIWDHSPMTIGATPVHPFSTDRWYNMASGQNFADSFILSTDTYLTGIDIYSNTDFGYIGQSVTVRLWSESTELAYLTELSGFYYVTKRVLLDEVISSISDIDSDGALDTMSRKHADVDPLLLLANTHYLIGMSGTDSQLGQAGLTTTSGDSSMVLFSGSTYDHVMYNNVMAFRLEGTTNIVPEPSTFILFSVSIAGIIGAGRYLRKQG